MSYPEHDKLHAVKDQRDTVQEFLDWLLGEYTVPAIDRNEEPTQARVRLCVETNWRETTIADVLRQIMSRRDAGEGSRDYESLVMGLQALHMGENARANLIAAFFDIDPKKLEDEKRAMLDEIRRES